ncbi:MAG: N-acetyl-1-D-myo-inositol-2-amino-2-deoxy-alpha-D-glucopyranoside deacetylase [Candidatus Phosphoribacter baldrii]
MARLLFVHAHPDDETLASGVAIAHYVSTGHDVEVLTATLGEEGEVIPPELAPLTADPDGALGPFRRGELATAIARLWARHTFLGAFGDRHLTPRWRDSGMAGMPSAHHPRAFAAADVAEVASVVAAYLRDRRPDVVVTYDREGGYGHPDHIQTRRAVEAALERLAPHERPARFFEIVTPRSWVDDDRRWLAEHVPPQAGLQVPGAAEPYAVSVVDDDVVTHVVIDDAARERQELALAAHRTQVSVHDGCYALSNSIAARLSGREAFVRLDPASGDRLPPESELWFDGLLVGAP